MLIENVCVFCGSNTGSNPAYLNKTLEIADEIAKRGIGLVYGGGSRGLMGELAVRVRQAGGRVTGISPKRFHKQGELDFEPDEYILVDTMHERKAAMYKKAQAFIALPGGMGTLDEFAEIFTWQHIGFTGKPIALCNVGGFFNPLLNMLRKMADEGFMAPEKLARLKISESPSDIFDYFETFEPLDAPWEG